MDNLYRDYRNALTKLQSMTGDLSPVGEVAYQCQVQVCKYLKNCILRFEYRSNWGKGVAN